MLFKELELTFLGRIAQLTQTLDSLEASSVLATRHNLALVLHQVLLGQTTGSVLGRAVVHLRLGANCHLRTTHHIHVVATSAVILTVLASHVATTTTGLSSRARSAYSIIRKVFGFHYTCSEDFLRSVDLIAFLLGLGERTPAFAELLANFSYRHARIG